MPGPGHRVETVEVERGTRKRAILEPVLRGREESGLHPSSSIDGGVDGGHHGDRVYGRISDEGHEFKSRWLNLSEDVM